MIKKIPTERIICNIVLISLGIVLSMMINVFNGLYQVVLPIHIPVIIAGLLLGPISGINVAVLAPILSNVFCGSPHVEDLLLIIFELICYGYISGFMKNKNQNIYITLIISLILGRTIYFVCLWILTNVSTIDLFSIEKTIKTIIKETPGIIIQIIIIPPILKKMKSGLKEVYGVIS